MKLPDFENQIDPVILNRGNDYFIANSVEELEQAEVGLWQAWVENQEQIRFYEQILERQCHGELSHYGLEEAISELTMEWSIHTSEYHPLYLSTLDHGIAKSNYEWQQDFLLRQKFSLLTAWGKGKDAEKQKHPETVKTYVKAIKHEMQSTGRPVYEKAAADIKKLAKLPQGRPAAQQLMKEFRLQYNNRKAMREIFDHTFGRD